MGFEWLSKLQVRIESNMATGWLLWISEDLRNQDFRVIIPDKTDAKTFEELETPTMPKFVIERDIPGAGSLTGEQLQGISQTSCNVLKTLGPEIQWVESYVTDDKIYCVYIAPTEELILQHAIEGGFPAKSVRQIRRMIDPTTAE